MIQEKTNEDKLVLLNETIAYYSEDINRRCTGKINDEGLDTCKYSPVTLNKSDSDGCAIGRLLTPELRLELDKKYNGKASGIGEIWCDIPDNIKVYGLPFLQELQLLHDSNRYWEDGGLSVIGKNQVEKIKNKFGL